MVDIEIEAYINKLMKNNESESIDFDLMPMKFRELIQDPFNAGVYSEIYGIGIYK